MSRDIFWMQKSRDIFWMEIVWYPTYPRKLGFLGGPMTLLHHQFFCKERLPHHWLPFAVQPTRQRKGRLNAGDIVTYHDISWHVVTCCDILWHIVTYCGVQTARARLTQLQKHRCFECGLFTSSVFGCNLDAIWMHLDAFGCIWYLRSQVCHSLWIHNFAWHSARRLLQGRLRSRAASTTWRPVMWSSWVRAQLRPPWWNLLPLCPHRWHDCNPFTKCGVLSLTCSVQRPMLGITGC